MRNISFMLTKEQIKNRTKTVTRRLGWWNLKKGDLLQGVEKGMGLKKGEQMVKLEKIRVVSTRREWLTNITKEDCILEGFPEMEPREFIEMFKASHKGCGEFTEVNRIEFEYV